MKILLIEDDPAVGELLTVVLAAHRYAVDYVMDGASGLDLALHLSYDLIALDLQLPDIDGIRLCQRLRSQGCTTPILILTSSNSSDDVIRGLDAGADDYVVKPCDTEQLLARIRALLRRSNYAPLATVLTWGELSLNPVSAQVTYQGQVVALRPKEYCLLELFLRHPQRVFNRNAILDHLWSLEDYPTEHAVTNLIKDLRRHLKAAGMTEEPIETVYGLGYRLSDRGDAKAWPDRSAVPVATSAPPTNQPGVVELNQVIQTFRQSLPARLTVLEQALMAVQQGHLAIAQRHQARQAAHRLAGSLGTFGYEQGSTLARSIEGVLSGDRPLRVDQARDLAQLLTDLQQALEVPELSPSSPSGAIAQRVVLVGEPTDFIQTLQQQAPAWNLGLDIVSREAWLKGGLPGPTAVLLLVFDGAMAEPDRLATLQRAIAQVPQVPVVVLAEQSSLSDRIHVARLGADRYLSQPLSPVAVFQALAQLLSPPYATDARVMAVDDDWVVLSSLVQLLQPWGIQVTCLNDPRTFWEVLTLTQPDLLLLDVEMPTFSGVELCQVVRQDSTYGDIPILVVTAHSDLSSVQQVFAAGADDLIQKPIVGPELVTRVTSRIERSRLRRQVEQLRQQQQTGRSHPPHPSSSPL